MIPNMLTENCVLRFDLRSVISVFVMVLGFAVSWYLGDLENNRTRLKKWLRRS
jgi:putative membrane protein